MSTHARSRWIPARSSGSSPASGNARMSGSRTPRSRFIQLIDESRNRSSARPGPGRGGGCLFEQGDGSRRVAGIEVKLGGVHASPSEPVLVLEGCELPSEPPIRRRRPGLPVRERAGPPPRAPPPRPRPDPWSTRRGGWPAPRRRGPAPPTDRGGGASSVRRLQRRRSSRGAGE